MCVSSLLFVSFCTGNIATMSTRVPSAPLSAPLDMQSLADTGAIIFKASTRLKTMLTIVQGGAGGPGGFGGLGGGGPMDFGRNKSKFQEVPETGVTFDDVAVRMHASVNKSHV